MALIKHRSSDRLYVLHAEVRVGRSSSADLRLDSDYVSSQHATLRWTNLGWEIRDLASRNHTYVTGRQLEPGVPTLVKTGDSLMFAREGQVWDVLDDSAPGVLVWEVGGTTSLPVDGLMRAIPSDNEPAAIVCQTAEGIWRLERPDGVGCELRGGDTFEVAGVRWKLLVPHAVFTTRLEPVGVCRELGRVRLCFSVSQDEEYVELRADLAGEYLPLGARNHNSVLLQLARQRLEDRERHMPETSCGWVYQDDLLKRVGISMPQLNTAVYRIRQQFLSLDLRDGFSVIERRESTRQLRIGVPALEIACI